MWSPGEWLWLPAVLPALGPGRMGIVWRSSGSLGLWPQDSVVGLPSELTGYMKDSSGPLTPLQISTSLLPQTCAQREECQLFMS